MLERGILSKPVLADLDGKRGLEIVVTALDGSVYAWRGDGKPLPGFPVVVEDKRTGRRSKLVSTPAVGDIDGDGRPEIVFGSNGVREGLAAAYAVHRDGNLHSGGPFLAGWDPVEVPLLRDVLLPTLAAGVQMTPTLVDVNRDGDMEVILYGVTGSGIVLLDHRPAAHRSFSIIFPSSPARTRNSKEPASSRARGLRSSRTPMVTADSSSTLHCSPLRMLTMRTSPGIPIDVSPVLGGGASRRAPAPTRHPLP
jgi:hypothetical protein